MKPKKEKQKKILFFDIETSHAVVAAFSLFNDSGIPHSSILNEWAIISIAYKFKGDKNVKVLMSKFIDAPNGLVTIDDSGILEKFSEVLNQADVVVGHNSDRFDIKKINTRLIFHRLPPIKIGLETIDTLKLAKKHFAFMSNRLDYISKYLGFEGKMNTPNGLWLRILFGDKKAAKIMGEYNAKDVIELENVYDELIKFDQIAREKAEPFSRPICRCCGSEHTVINKTKLLSSGFTSVGFVCRDCGKYMSVKQDI